MWITLKNRPLRGEGGEGEDARCAIAQARTYVIHSAPGEYYSGSGSGEGGIVSGGRVTTRFSKRRKLLNSAGWSARAEMSTARLLKREKLLIRSFRRAQRVGE